MKVKWLGHASFLITSDSGTKIITDPYTAAGPFKYGEITESADIVTVSHQHGDHNNVASVRGNPAVVSEATSTERKGVKIKGVPSFHDASSGSERGANIMFCLEVDGVNVCHLGDLGHQLSDEEVAELGKVDVLLTPVGGFYTIDGNTATELSNKLSPKVVIPMHFKNDKCELPIGTEEEFLQGKDTVSRLGVSEVEFSASALPASSQIIVLDPAL